MTTRLLNATSQHCKSQRYAVNEGVSIVTDVVRGGGSARKARERARSWLKRIRIASLFEWVATCAVFHACSNSCHPCSNSLLSRLLNAINTGRLHEPDRIILRAPASVGCSVCRHETMLGRLLQWRNYNFGPPANIRYTHGKVSRL